MSKIISILNQKGGVGKSNVTTLLANIFHFHFDFKIAVIDCDFPQHTIAKKRQRELKVIENSIHLKQAYDRVYATQSPYPIIPTDLSSIELALSKIDRADYDYIFFDIKGTMDQENIVPFLKSVNVFFIPVLQEETAIISSLEFYESLLKQIKPISTNYEYCSMFFNLVPGQNRLNKLLPALSAKFNFMQSYLKRYTVYQNEFHSTIFPIPKNRTRDLNAKKNLFQLANEIKTVLGSISLVQNKMQIDD